ncbi:MAG TPA: hypothetical protein DCE42_26650 [Myxococcales bacterium]|nr:hypothetical protein [Deltaproteobacteria bacterium]HAA58371.1 hypothetical protein [Myxococcales bacterium]|tara:strand:- start:1923 stop:2525 length:603 start_codon:yes stop_codon:yes gene_type:complete
MTQQVTHEQEKHTSFARGIRYRYFTFKRLVEMPLVELDNVFARGQMPDIEDLVGWEFRGCNTRKVTRLMGIRKFRKGFFRTEDTDPHELFGYNVQVRQNATYDPFLALPNEFAPKKFGYYLVTPGRPHGPDNMHPQALLIDYSRGPENPPHEPANVLRDYLVQVDPDNNDLFLGKAYAALGPKRVFLSYFVLERYNHIGL